MFITPIGNSYTSKKQDNTSFGMQFRLKEGDLGAAVARAEASIIDMVRKRHDTGLLGSAFVEMLFKKVESFKVLPELVLRNDHRSSGIFAKDRVLIKNIRIHLPEIPECFCFNPSSESERLMDQDLLMKRVGVSFSTVHRSTGTSKDFSFSELGSDTFSEIEAGIKAKIETEHPDVYLNRAEEKKSFLSIFRRLFNL